MANHLFTFGKLKKKKLNINSPSCRFKLQPEYGRP
jgi:hypothetical protein